MKLLNKFFKSPVALVLAGGGARGVAHLGVIKYLEENNYDFDFIVGTSAGAIFGALYLTEMNVDSAYNKFIETFKKSHYEGNLFMVEKNEKKLSILANLKEKLFFAKTVFKDSVLDSKLPLNVYQQLFENYKNFEDLKKQIYIVATDLISCKDIIFSKGKLIPAIMASTAIPGVFPPVKYKNYFLIDGGNTQNIPCGLARKLGAKRILAVDIKRKLTRVNDYPTALNVLIRSERITANRLNDYNRLHADLIIKPYVNQVHWFEFDKYEELFQAGYNEAIINKHKIKKFFKHRFFKSADIIPEKSFILE